MNWTSPTPPGALAELFERTLLASPHIDDDVFAAGTLAKATEAGCEVHVAIAGSADHYQPHAGGVVTAKERLSEMERAAAVVGLPSFSVGFPGHDARLDLLPLADVVRWLEECIAQVRPTAVLLPVPSHHQDHRVVFEAAVAALRPSGPSPIRLVAAYEYPLSAVWPPPYPRAAQGGRMLVDISGPFIEQKIRALKEHRSQVVGRPENHPLHPEAIRNLAAFRGLEIGVDFAEVLYLLRAVL